MRTAENHSQGQAAENLNQQAGENRNAWRVRRNGKEVRTWKMNVAFC